MNDIVSARLDIIAAKAKILAEASRRGFWSGELERGLREIETEISELRRGSGSSSQWDSR